MKDWLVVGSEAAITLIDAVALWVILIGTVEVIVGAVRMAFGVHSNQYLREVWLRYARWLVAALTFQLRADIIGTSISSSWETTGVSGRLP